MGSPQQNYNLTEAAAAPATAAVAAAVAAAADALQLQQQTPPSHAAELPAVAPGHITHTLNPKP